jgi:ABC-2 type transport system permease protein
VRLVYTELLKIRTAPRTTLALVLGLVALSVLGSGSAASGENAADEALLWDALSIGTTATLFALILGILVVTWEYRHGTITQTYLVTPRRERVMAAKYGMSATLGVVLTAISLLVVLITASFLISIDLTVGQWELIGRIVLAGALWAVLGAGLGALLQSQVGAIVAVFVWFLIAEPLIGVRYDHFADYLPGGSLDGLTRRGQPAGFEGAGDQGYSYGIWTAGIVAGAYAVILAVLGTISAIWRDV